MIRAIKSGLIWITVAGTMFLCFNTHAGSDTMLKLLEVLRNNGTIDEEAYLLLKEAAMEEQAETGVPEIPASEQKSASEAPTVAEKAAEETAQTRVEYEGAGVRIKSADGKYEFRTNGYLQVDLAEYDNTSIPMGSGGEVRRARVTWRGLIGDTWLFRTSLDFADGADIKSTYLDYKPTENSAIRFGSFKEPFSMEELSSSRYTTFMERAMVNTLAPGRSIGLGYSNQSKHHTLKLGVYSDEAREDSDAGWATTGRVTYAPRADDGNVTHLGVSASYRDLREGNEVRFRSRPESHVTDVRLIDTGDITDGSSLARYGVEAAMVKGPFSFQSEYIRADLDRIDAPGLVFDGWYAYATWTLTGESREYDTDNGRFRRIKPQAPLGGGGSGAWELGLRYSNADLNDLDIIGGEEDNVTLALNWYPHRNVRFSLNYVNVLEVDRPGSETDGETPDIYQLRGQIQF